MDPWEGEEDALAAEFPRPEPDYLSAFAGDEAPDPEVERMLAVQMPATPQRRLPTRPKPKMAVMKVPGFKPSKIIPQRKRMARKSIGTRLEVWRGQARSTSGCLRKSDLVMRKGRVITKRQAEAAAKKRVAKRSSAVARQRKRLSAAKAKARYKAKAKAATKRGRAARFQLKLRQMGLRP